MILKPRRAAEDVQRKEKMTKGSLPGGYHITSQRHTIKTQNPANRTSNVAVFAPDGSAETYDYSYDGNWLGFLPDESTVQDRQLWH